MKSHIIFFLSFIYLLSLEINANHIVGGEIEMEHLGDSNSYDYRIKLIQYFDCAQTANPGPDDLIYYKIFRNSDGQQVGDGTMPITNQEFVPYTNPDCALGFLCTLKVEYSHEITLSPNIFNHPDGYTIVWERCCRNRTIKNLIDPGWNGMTYTLHFPPVVDENGDRFINSSPRLFPPLSDYACVNQLFYIDFAGIDNDGDSIAYSLVPPLDDHIDNDYTKNQIESVGVCEPSYIAINGSGLCYSLVVPDPTPSPHPIVNFASGYNVSNLIPGDPALSISNEGFITVTPQETGLYVFSVKADEFRDGVKIGQARRDFQMLVVDGCNPPDPPEALVLVPGKNEFYSEDDTIIYVASQPKCFDLFVTDDVGTNVTLEALGVNFDINGRTGLNDIFSISNGLINQNGDTLKVEVCLSDCPYVQNEPYIIDLIAADDACPLPQRDTVRVTIIVEPPTNKDPFFINQNDTNSVVIPWNTTFTTLIQGLDTDNDSLTLNYFTVPSKPEINLNDYGISFNKVNDNPGNISYELSVNADCKVFDYQDKNDFMIGFVLDDLDTCDIFNMDTIFYDLEVDLPDNTGPIISSDEEITDSVPSRPNFSVIEVETNLSGTYSLNLFSDDEDKDSVIIYASGDGFDINDINGIFSTFNSAPGNIDGTFEIDFECINFPYNNIDEYKINFISEDIDYCQEINSDTIQLLIKIMPDPNAIPEITNNPLYVLDVNNSFEIDINASDNDKSDMLHLKLLSDDLPGQFSFNEAYGLGDVTSKLTWIPTCNELNNDFSDKIYELTFQVSDNSCPLNASSLKTIQFLLKKPIINWDNFKPPNAFSPNNDNINDKFTLTNLPSEYQNLPLNVCDDNFEYIVFVDRTGVEVFKSYNKEFEWDGGGLSSGVYFYYINYTKSDYKGSVTIIY
ncbi:MAG: gliding motility-associated C-terminal domain-containing protein [Flammeovirgaceae bacterium TMED290]|nr:MAG: gliding motility-associated C-terminal domain-containing protein [Flammeovirgaceae bacterium TMED290]|tara:strand:- start:5348 stop:8068 length:2721 start_codon:yes stop_codon:yes gene_type:complete